jgi:glycosyltransferase involved in cell wall biosynthesis
MNTPPTSRLAPVLISLPDGLNVSGVTLWAVRLAGLLAADGGRGGREVTLALHDEPPGQSRLAITLPPGVRVLPLAGCASLRNTPGDLAACLPAYRDAIRAMARAARSPVVYIPTLLGDSFALGAAISMIDPDLIRIVGWQHADIAYDARVLAHYEPVIAAFAGVSGRVALTLADALPHRAADIRHIPNAVPVGHAPPERTPARSRPLRLVYTGRLEQRQKRVLALIHLSDELDRRGVDHTLSIIGDGPAAGEVRAMAEHPARRARVVAPGAMAPAELRGVLRDADCFVLASRYEGLSVAMLEAMAEGCVPVVTGVDSGAAEAVIDGLHGVLVDAHPDDPDEAVAVALADGVQRFLAGDTREMGMQAWRRVGESFSLERFGARASALIDAAAQAPARAWPADRPAAFTSRPGSGASSGTVPAEGAQRLRDALHSLAGRRVVLHGAGRHTIELAAALADSPAAIVGVTDDDPARWGGTLLGWPIVAPDQVGDLGATDVIISSWIHADAIFARRAAYERRGLVVHHLYRRSESAANVSYTPAACTN